MQPTQPQTGFLFPQKAFLAYPQLLYPETMEVSAFGSGADPGCPGHPRVKEWPAQTVGNVCSK